MVLKRAACFKCREDLAKHALRRTPRDWLALGFLGPDNPLSPRNRKPPGQQPFSGLAAGSADLCAPRTPLGSTPSQHAVPGLGKILWRQKRKLLRSHLGTICLTPPCHSAKRSICSCYTTEEARNYTGSPRCGKTGRQLHFYQASFELF